MASVKLTPELAAAEARIKIARKIAKILSDLNAVEANAVLDMARRDPLEESEPAAPAAPETPSAE